MTKAMLEKKRFIPHVAAYLAGRVHRALFGMPPGSTARCGSLEVEHSCQRSAEWLLKSLDNLPPDAALMLTGALSPKDLGDYPPVRRSSMLLATSSQTAAKSRSSCLPKTFAVFSASCRYVAASCRR